MCVRFVDLDLRELLAFNSEGGVLRFGGERVLLFDPVALGILRKQLWELLGETATRGLFMRLGYAHGWRTAETLHTSFEWDNDREWQQAGGRLHQLQGLVRVEPVARGGASSPLAEALWHDSHEAEQHLLHIGRAQQPVCWSLVGFASGYLSRVHGRAIICFEERCVGKGDAVCSVVGRPREEWGEDRAEEIALYEEQCLTAALDKLAAELRRAERKLRQRKLSLDRARAPEETPGLAARSVAMRRTVELARRAAHVDSTLLITGESGSGKEAIARLVHAESRRVAGPFASLRCGGVPEVLLESELFGHRKDAFPGAIEDRIGLFESTQSGTVLLDEVNEVSPAIQLRLLRLLTDGLINRVGETRSRTVDVRILAATHRDLLAEVGAERFRQDLYYRLRVVEIAVPPLRSRVDDILPLARGFISDASTRLGRKLVGLTARAASRLSRYPWPGNVRELMNAMERAVLLADGERVDVGDLPSEIAGLADAPRDGASDRLAELERAHILDVVRRSRSKAEAAERLGIGTATLFRKLREYGGG